MGLYIPQSLVLNNATVPGAVLSVPVGGPYDALKSVKCGYILWDPEVPTLDTGTRQLTSLFNQFPIAYDSTVSVAADSHWNNHKVFDFTSGSQHYMHVNDRPAPLALAASGLPSFDLILTASVPQSVLDLIDAFGLTASYMMAKYDTPNNVFISGLNIFGTGGNKGFSLTPKSASGNGFNILWTGSASSGTKYDQTRPVDSVPFLLRWKFEYPRTDFYWRALDVAITSRGDHTAYDDGVTNGGINSRYQIGSFAPVGSNSASWRGKMGIGGVFDRSNPATALTDAQAEAFGTAVRAWYGIT